MINGDEVKSNITKNIIKFREKTGMSQKELAKRLNVSPSRVSNWEQGSNCPTIEILFEVCKILGVSINDIYGVYPDSEMNLSYDEQDHIKKYRDLDQHGKKMVDFTLNEEWKRSIAGGKVIPMSVREDTEFSTELAPDKDYLKPQAAHNDKENEEQIALMKEDMSILKRPN